MKKIFVITLLIVLSGCSQSNDLGNITSSCQATDHKDACPCTKEYDPVCGCDHETYPNSCVAGCSGIEDYSPGQCEINFN